MTPNRKQSNATGIELILLGLSALFTTIATFALWTQARAYSVLIPGGLTLAGGILAHLVLNKWAPGRDPIFLPIAMLLTSWGILIIARVAPNFLVRQYIWMVVSLFAMCLVAANRDRLRWLRRLKYTWLIGSLVLLGTTLVMGVNPAGEGARRWLSIAGLFFQPSEILRLLMTTFLAAFYSERIGLNLPSNAQSNTTKSTTGESRGLRLNPRYSFFLRLAPSIVMWFAAVSLQITQQDIGASALLVISYVLMLYLATGNVYLPIGGMFMLISAVFTGYFLSTTIALRVNIWLNPWIDPQGSAFQIIQSLISVASGNLIGQGPGQGRPIYVPAVHTDFPFAAIAEEFGFIGVVAMLLLFAFLIMRSQRIMRGTQSAYYFLLAGGICALLISQLAVIVSGNLGLIPLTGVTVPFVSYGGSSLLVSFISIGLLIRLSCEHGSAIHLSDGHSQFSKHAIAPNLDHILTVTLKQRSASTMLTRLHVLMIVILVAASGYWGIINSATLVNRDDNPRLVDAQRAINRGPILSNDGTALAYSVPENQNTGFNPVVFSRHYPISSTASIVGYYSLWHGVGGIEGYADISLRGMSRPFDELLHISPTGAPFTTTIDLSTQNTLAWAMGGKAGAAVVMDWHTGDVLALLSSPTYNPERLDQTWDSLRNASGAPLLNRATQGLYQPGSLLKWVYETDHRLQNHLSVVNHEWDSNDTYNLGQPVSFELDNASVPYPTAGSISETIGQGSLRVTPLRMAVTAAWLASGHPVTPTLSFRNQTHYISTIRSSVIAEYTGTAQSSEGFYVGWYVGIDTQKVIVITLESQTIDSEQLATIVSRLKYNRNE